MTDAKTLLERLREHDAAAESLVDQSAALHRRVAAMREAGAVLPEQVGPGRAAPWVGASGSGRVGSPSDLSWSGGQGGRESFLCDGWDRCRLSSTCLCLQRLNLSVCPVSRGCTRREGHV